MSNINKQALREAAEKATKGSYIVGHTSVNQHGNLTGVFVCQKWKGEPGGVIAECHVNCLVETDVQAYANAEFIAAFNPKVALALLDERERNQQYIKSRDQENEEIALTVGKLRVELEGKDSKIANLTAERDALREGEMGDARHSNTRAAADIYFQLVEECEIPAGGSLVEYVDDMREKLEAAEKRIAELEANKCKPVMFIDGDISPADADKLAAVIREFNEETETPAARMARIIRENPHPTNMCDMPAAGIGKGE
ncbi:ead/Ea22-like family protein [Escherichia coli]|nr:ead/Ea22-like family protein [Escherichia coli]